jgi:hypothetical protein
LTSQLLIKKIYLPTFIDVMTKNFAGKTTISLSGFSLYGAEWELEIYSQAQNLVKKVSGVKLPEVIINTEGWIEGVYLIKATVGGKMVTGKLAVTRQ